MNIITTLRAKNRGVRLGQVEFIIVHDTAGSGTVNDAKYLASDPEHRGISVDFCVLKTGDIYQLNQDLRGHCTYHAGRHTRFRSRINGAVNQHSIGIEISQKANMKGLDPPYPPEQVKAIAELCRSLCDEFHLGADDITTHAKIITDGSRSDPRLFPWPEFWGYFGSTVGIPEVPPVVVTGTSYTVKEGDTLWAIANAYHTTVEAIKAANNMNDASNLITPGQILTVYVG